LPAPRSHSSLPLPVLCTRPSPHTAGLHERVQSPVFELLTPWSHASLFAGCRKPSPHLAAVQLLVHMSSLLWLPSSHCSCAETTPSPQVARAQLLVHSSASFWLPSSQPSPGPTLPSPQK